MGAADVKTFNAFRAGEPPLTQLGKVDATSFDYFRGGEPVRGFVQTPPSDAAASIDWTRYPKPKLRRPI